MNKHLTAPRKIAPRPRPAWLSLNSTTFCVDDWWLECTDPENIVGECCTGYFERSDAGDLTLCGVMIVSKPGFVDLISREDLINRVTESEIEALEARLKGMSE